MNQHHFTRRTLVSQVVLRQELLRYYLAELLRDQDFVSELKELFQQATAYVAAHPDPEQARQALRTVFWETAPASLPVDDALAALAHARDRFLARWPLPADVDLYVSWRVSHEMGRPHLLPRIRLCHVPDIEWKGAGALEQLVPVIVPNLPLPFPWDPIEEGRAVLHERIEAICRDLRESILRQAEAFEQTLYAHGWVKKPPHWKPEQAARRLYWRLVRRLSWRAIACLELGHSDEVALQDRKAAVMQQVRRAAQLLGLSLRPRGVGNFWPSGSKNP